MSKPKCVVCGSDDFSFNRTNDSGFTDVARCQRCRAFVKVNLLTEKVTWFDSNGNEVEVAPIFTIKGDCIGERAATPKKEYRSCVNCQMYDQCPNANRLLKFSDHDPKNSTTEEFFLNYDQVKSEVADIIGKHCQKFIEAQPIDHI